ncbi:MAG: phosphoserine phosphatase SerB [Gammaproteobacteria bacterium]|nr:phosphoserine phosphatase SerB [Gammaproteobacteria bacterium]
MTSPTSTIVIQGSALVENSAALPRLDGGHWLPLRPDLVIFAGARSTPQLRNWAELKGLDIADIPASQNLSEIGLVVMDMDSTLIAIECIDEIAAMQGIKAQVASITEACMRGELDFDQGLRQRVGLLAGLEEQALERVYRERLRFNPGAETLIQALKQRDIQTLLVSGGFTYFTDRVQARLGLNAVCSNRLEIIDGRLTGQLLGEIVNGQTKAEQLQAHATRLGLKQHQVIAIGDGANDLQMLAAAGISIAYHAKPVVRQQADFALNHVGLDGLLNLFSDHLHSAH